MLTQLHEEAIERIQEEYRLSTSPWIIGFSGGKDSSALLKIVFIALLRLKRRPIPVTIVYCDTGVEIPLVRSFVHATLRELSSEARIHSVPFKSRILSPSLDNRFFVKVIGRGYPPPTNKFRWCTDKLRIDPVQVELERHGKQNSTLLLGLRHGESNERDRTLSKYQTERSYYFNQSNNRQTQIFSPILDFSVLDVWKLLRIPTVPNSIDGAKIEMLYQFASGECPIIRDPQSPPCGKGRFGCWTCTVIRKDRAMTNLVHAGRTELEPLLNFRNWLAVIRDNTAFRAKRRRNGTLGLGPFTLAARREILKELKKAQKKSGLALITESEIKQIHHLWRQDKASSTYKE